MTSLRLVKHSMTILKMLGFDLYTECATDPESPPLWKLSGLCLPTNRRYCKCCVLIRCLTAVSVYYLLVNRLPCLVLHALTEHKDLAEQTESDASDFVEKHISDSQKTFLR